MLETIANPMGKGDPLPTFLTTPRSMMPGSWACESPRVYPEPHRQVMSADRKLDKNLSIEIPTLEGPRGGSRPEQRDAAENADTCCAEDHQANQVSTQPRHDLPPLGADSPSGKYECDYDLNPTSIFLNLQKKEWNAAAKKANEDSEEAHTWVSRKEKHGKLRWRLLPIHAAIIFKAPENVVKTLLAAYPKGAQCKDDQGMLPLHLAFRHGSSEGTVNLLLAAFPQSVDVKDRKGRIPLVLAQASASPNRDAFVRALERGPTYYANAAAATERAAVTAEQRAIFDSKLIEVEKKHQQDVNILKEERKGLTETVELLQKELAKQKGATQVLVDHVNSLEAQLKSKTETERFLAVKAATLDSNFKEMAEEKEQMEQALEDEIAEIRKQNAELQRHLNSMKTQHGSDEEVNSDEFKHLKDKATKQEKELKSLKMDWASAQARAAVLEAQLKSKIENEHELASQVSHLAGKLAESAADNGSAANIYSRRVQVLEEERAKLRATVNDLGKKLLKVSQFMNKMTQKTHEKSTKTCDDAKQKRAKLLADASNHEHLIRVALAERQHMAELLKKQEEEMERSARQHQEILEKLAELKSVPTQDHVGDDLPFSHSLTEEMQDMMNSVLQGMPQQVPSDDSDMVDAVMKNVVVAASSNAKRKGGKEVTMSEQSFLRLRSSSTDFDDDPQKCLEEALRALELSRTKSIVETHQLKSMSEASEETTLSCNPSDEESEALQKLRNQIQVGPSEEQSGC